MATKHPSHCGLALFSYGFRPFFLAGALYAGLTMLTWLPVFQGELALRSVFSPVDWHVHEMLYGFLPAIITGFLLTAVPNWTGRPPVQGPLLLALVMVWLAGRIAVTLSEQIGWVQAAIIDVAFLALMGAVIARDIIASSNTRNLKIVLMILLLLAGNAAFHLEAHLYGQVAYGNRVGISVVIMLVMIIGGRIIPTFSINWLKQQHSGRLPVAFNNLDTTVLAVSFAALAAWIFLPAGRIVAVLMLFAGLANIVRLARWAGDRTFRNPLLFILHAGYAFVPLGFLLMAAAQLDQIPESAAIHAWTAGVFGVMTLAMMTRVSLGHTGRPLVASIPVQMIYAAIVLSACARIAAALSPQWNTQLLHIAAYAWALAFFGFAVLFAPKLIRPRRNA